MVEAKLVFAGFCIWVLFKLAEGVLEAAKELDENDDVED